LSPAKTLEKLVAQGFRFEARGDVLHVTPRPDDATAVIVRSEKPAILSFVAEHGGRWPLPLATEHRYVLWSGVLDRSRSSCIACGKPPNMHGDAALDRALIVDDPKAVVLWNARAVVASATAESIATDLAP